MHTYYVHAQFNKQNGSVVNRYQTVKAENSDRARQVVSLTLPEKNRIIELDKTR